MPTTLPLMPIVLATPEFTMTAVPLDHFRAALRADRDPVKTIRVNTDLEASGAAHL